MDGNGKDDLLVDFVGGLWVRYDNATWVKLHNTSPLHVLTADLDNNGKDEVVIGLGSSGGVGAPQ